MGPCLPKPTTQAGSETDLYMNQMRDRLAKNLTTKQESSPMTIHNYKDHQIIGIGSYGSVFLVKDPERGENLAIKRVRKTKDRAEQALREKNILFATNFPFIVQLFYTFKNHEYVYFVLEAAMNGSLAHCTKDEPQNEDVTLFWVAQMVLAIEYLHSVQIMHRDLKPENILMLSNGYLKLTDFDTAISVGEKGTAHSFCGTPRYLAPEIVAHKPYSYGVDWWNIGTLAFYLLHGLAPYQLDCAEERLDWNGDLDDSWPGCGHSYFTNGSVATRDFLYLLLRADPDFRLGVMFPGSTGVRKHPCFDNFDFPALYKKRMRCPKVPKLTGGIVKRSASPLDLVVAKKMKYAKEYQNF